MKQTIVLDTECYKDYWLLMAKRIDNKVIRLFELHDDSDPLNTTLIRQMLGLYRCVTFNGRNYDAPMIALALKGATTGQLKAASDQIITKGMKPWEFEKAFGVTLPVFDHVDLMEVAPGMAGLKIYGGRLHTKRLQDLPIEPDASISPEQRTLLRRYCENDLDLTAELLAVLTPQIQLREQMGGQYGMDLRSKSDAQIAETVIRSEVEQALHAKIQRPYVAPGTAFHYHPPEYLAYQTPLLQEVFRTVCTSQFLVGDGSKAKNKIKDDDGNDIAAKGGNVELPDAIDTLKITIGKSTYKMGIGGLHSTESKIAYSSDANNVLIDVDVASYYPNIIRTLRLYPKHMGDVFIRVYSGIIDRRIAAKRSGNKVVDATLKIVLNGSFGKFGSKWSTLFSPDLMIQTTVTGQLALLMLIERFELSGIPVISANTDGIVTYCPRHLVETMKACVKWWERVTTLEMEETRYRALYSQSVNTYLAVKEDGAVKTKGLFATGSLAKNPVASICVKAVTKYLVDGTPITNTISASDDIREFVTLRTVRGGGEWGGEYLGKTVRWYQSIFSDAPIRYVTNGNKVPKTDGCRPLMELCDGFPADLDLDWYIAEATGILKKVGL